MSIDHDVLDDFELVEKGKGHRSTDPQLTIYGNGGGYLNAVAVDVIGDHPAVRAFVDGTDYRVAFVGADGDGDHDYSLDRDSETSGGDFRMQSALRQLGIGPDDIDETHQFPLSNEDGVLVGDVSELSDGGELTETSDDETTRTSSRLSTTCPSRRAARRPTKQTPSPRRSPRRRVLTRTSKTLTFPTTRRSSLTTCQCSKTRVQRQQRRFGPTLNTRSATVKHSKRRVVRSAMPSAKTVAQSCTR